MARQRDPYDPYAIDPMYGAPVQYTGSPSSGSRTVGQPVGTSTITYTPNGRPTTPRPPMGGVTGGNGNPANPANHPPSPPPTYDTDGYAQPGYIPTGFGNVLPGWDAQKWNDPNHQTPKYVVGRILSKYEPSPAGLQAAMTEIQKAYPGARLVGKDSVYIPGVGTTDVGVSFGDGTNMRWGYGSEAQARLSGSIGAGGGSVMPSISAAQAISQARSSNPLGDLVNKTYSDLLKQGGPTNSALQSAQSALQGLIDNGGGFNENIVNRRMESQREVLERARRSQIDQLNSELAARGLMGAPGAPSGAEAIGLGRIADSIGGQFATAARDITTSELQAANERFAGAVSAMSGLGIAQAQNLISLLQNAGQLSVEEEQNIIQRIALSNNMSIEQAKIAFEYAQLSAQTALGYAGLNVQSQNNQMNYSLGLGQLGLGREQLAGQQQSGLIDQIIQLLGLQQNGVQNSQGGYI